ncbi:MAG: AAA family ATPase [Candidatus Shapirobacteria bacterium]|nr:AAA family ATPase [Candidatus Shapirobacteria bacterium]MDD3002309.1 AAA family ATPase [Candidatus Shapirobacteria bacterium]MDD4382686.1 AAA family ATPase [Candidatus Shapirobacteria bacterium]
MSTFPSTLIIAKNKETIDKKICQICSKLNHKFNQNNPDILLIDQSSGWGIDQIRKINNFLSQKPFSHQSKIIIILETQNLNTESQNALLKILEEPGKDNYIILTTNKIKSILPTIISRCSTIKISEKSDIKIKKEIDITGNLIKDLALSEKLGKNKEDILPLLENQLYFYQQELIKNPNQKNIYLVEKIIKAIQMINANVDPKNALDYVFIV